MQIFPNQLVELHLDSTGGPLVLRTRVEDAHDNILLVGAPLQRGNLVPIRVGTKLGIEFKSTDAAKEGRFCSEAVVERRFTAKIPLLQLRLLHEWAKTQDRRFVRVPVFIDAVFVPTQEGEELEARTGVILNLSGGGFLLRTAFSFNPDDEIKVSFNVEDQSVVAFAYLARFVPTEKGHDYGFAFIELSEQVRMNIIRYVYKRQIELRSMAREDSGKE
ncbi:MAG TPA: hypothetical protein GX521_08395 [Firmicutes bacterium]|nr:hypothetical protein [Bacillota bacterium]